MTDPGALTEGYLLRSDDGSYDDGPYADGAYEDGTNDDGGDALGEYTYPDDADTDWDSYLDTWETVASPPAPPRTPWFRNPRLLFGLIAVAAAALVVSTVLLITGKGSGEIPTTPQLSIRTTPSATSTPPDPAEPVPSKPPSSSPSAESPPPETEEAPVPVEPERSVEVPAPPPAPTAGPAMKPAGPRINVTRTPMSFTPGKP